MMRVMRRVTLLCMLALAGLAGGLGCRGRSEPVLRGESGMATPTIQQVLEAHTDEWMALPGVVGAGIGQVEGLACIKIFVDRPRPELTAKIPATLDGYRILVDAIGEIRALDSE